MSADSSSVTDTSQSHAAGTATTELTFKASIDLREQHLTLGDRRWAAAARMEISAEIVQDERSVLEYRLSPVQKAAREAATER